MKKAKYPGIWWGLSIILFSWGMLAMAAVGIDTLVVISNLGHNSMLDLIELFALFGALLVLLGLNVSVKRACKKRGIYTIYDSSGYSHNPSQWWW